jgi:hypothetical protein
MDCKIVHTLILLHILVAIIILVAQHTIDRENERERGRERGRGKEREAFLTMITSQVDHSQGDRIGRIFAQWAIVCFWQVFEK